jgi:alpha-ribazole phosphatase
MRIVLVRHYKTLGNTANEIIGWTTSPPANGWQADLCYVTRRLHKSRITFDSVYTSHLERARKTGQYYKRSLSIEKQQSTRALNELNYGRMCKKNKHWVEKNIPWHKKDAKKVYPDGESFIQMQRRSVAFIDALARKQGAADILIVAHAGVIRGLICHYLRLDYPSNLKRKIGHRYIGDFTIKKGRCRKYQERGIPSGFLTDGIVKNPWRR